MICICKNCGEEKKHDSLGLCNKCYIRYWRANNREKDKETQKRWRAKNSEYDRHWRARHLEYFRHWRDNNPNYRKEYDKQRCQYDINFKIRNWYGTRVGIAIKNNHGIKAYKTTELLGCSIQQCREHLEKQFKENMTWDNYGYYGWHIDHIKPCASFNLIDPEQQKLCFHYTNLQPLWAEENLRKGAKT